MSTKNSELHNFADDNTITCSPSTLSQLIKDLQTEPNKATDWFNPKTAGGRGGGQFDPHPVVFQKVCLLKRE